MICGYRVPHPLDAYFQRGEGGGDTLTLPYIQNTYMYNIMTVLWTTEHQPLIGKPNLVPSQTCIDHMQQVETVCGRALRTRGACISTSMTTARCTISYMYTYIHTYIHTNVIEIFFLYGIKLYTQRNKFMHATRLMNMLRCITTDSRTHRSR